MERDIEQIIIHCSDTPKGKWFDIDDIRKWHVEERGWRDVGYHFVITLDGRLQTGRPIEQSGAHARGYNSNSVGICYIGGGNGIDTRTPEQKACLKELISLLKQFYPKAEVFGHSEVSPKLCPCYNARAEYENL